MGPCPSGQPGTRPARAGPVEEEPSGDGEGSDGAGALRASPGPDLGHQGPRRGQWQSLWALQAVASLTLPDPGTLNTQGG